MVNLLLDSIELLDSAELLHPVRSIDAVKTIVKIFVNLVFINILLNSNKNSLHLHIIL